MSPKLREEPIDEELAKIKAAKLQEMLEDGRKKAKSISDNRNLTRPQEVALHALEKGVAFEVVTQTVDFGPTNPQTKQVERFHPKRKGLIVSLLVEPEEKQWIEHLLLTLRGVLLKKKEQQMVVQHIQRLHYEGALKDYYEFYGLSLKELKEKEEEERTQGHVKKADRLRAVIRINTGRK